MRNVKFSNDPLSYLKGRIDDLENEVKRLKNNKVVTVSKIDPTTSPGVVGQHGYDLNSVPYIYGEDNTWHTIGGLTAVGSVDGSLTMDTDDPTPGTTDIRITPFHWSYYQTSSGLTIPANSTVIFDWSSNLVNADNIGVGDQVFSYGTTFGDPDARRKSNGIHSITATLQYLDLAATGKQMQVFIISPSGTLIDAANQCLLQPPVTNGDPVVTATWVGPLTSTSSNQRVQIFCNQNDTSDHAFALSVYAVHLGPAQWLQE